MNIRNICTFWRLCACYDNCRSFQFHSFCQSKHTDWRTFIDVAIIIWTAHIFFSHAVVVHSFTFCFNLLCCCWMNCFAYAANKLNAAIFGRYLCVSFCSSGCVHVRNPMKPIRFELVWRWWLESPPKKKNKKQ